LARRTISMSNLRMRENYDLSYSANVIIFREMESRAGGLVRLPGSVGARPEGQSGAGLPVPVCHRHRVGLRRQLC